MDLGFRQAEEFEDIGVFDEFLRVRGVCSGFSGWGFEKAQEGLRRDRAF